MKPSCILYVFYYRKHDELPSRVNCSEYEINAILKKMLNSPADKKELIKVIKNDPSLFEHIVLEYQNTLINFHFRFTGSRADAEDLTQDTFIKAYKKLHTLKEFDKLRSWLFCIARRVSIDHYRKYKNREIPIDNEALVALAVKNESQSPEVLAEKNEVNREMKKCISSLPQEDRLLIELLYYYEFSYKEISEILNINKNTLKSRLYRTRKTLVGIVEKNTILKGASLS